MHDPQSRSEQRAAIERLAHQHLAPPDAETFVAALRPAIRLQHAPDASTRSRVGGHALLDPGTAWPSWRSRPLSFLMVLDLAEIAGIETDLELPPAGLLNFFYDAREQETWGFDPADVGSWRVVPADPAAARSVAPPGGAETFTEVPLRPEALVTHPSFEEPAVREILRRDRDRCFDLEEALEPVGWPDQQLHQVGGWPRLEQGALWLEAQLASSGLYVGDSAGYRDPLVAALRAGADDWVLLAQIDTDEPAGWMWGDVGMLYYLIRRQDLAARDFEKVWMILQCS